MTPLRIADRIAAWCDDQRARRFEALRVTNPDQYRVVMRRMADMLKAKADPEARAADRAIRADLETESTP